MRMAMDEVSSPSRIEGGSGEAQACTRAASGARRAPTAADEARHQSYDTNDDHTTTTARWTTARWTIDVTSADTDDATGPPAMPMGTSTTEEGQGRRERVAVDVGKPIGLEKVSNCRRARHQRVFAGERPPGLQ